MSKKYCSCIQYSFYTEGVRRVNLGPHFYRRKEVLAETGGAVSALTPEEHTVLRQQVPRIV
ncbi:hypothetical protein KOSB73_110014 [Klebsiella grimontii]|uniref:Uncharacterized protein n=1 Tax=Klebsiella grimontii TaxID=2058152 RepID=A0A285AV52_9ENTR|nr:hypothetical protein KOSB73_110014 [Klebsiella grimontii]